MAWLTFVIAVAAGLLSGSAWGAHDYWSGFSAAHDHAGSSRSLIMESERIVNDQRQQEYRESQAQQRLNDQEQARMRNQMELDRQQWDRIYDRGERGYRR